MSVEKILIAYRQELAKTIGALKSEDNSLATLSSAEFMKEDLRRRVAIGYLIEMIDKYCGLQSNDEAESRDRLQIIAEIAEQVKRDLQAEARILLNTWIRASRLEQRQMYPKLSALLIEHDLDLDSMLNDSGAKETPINDDQPKPAIEVNGRKNGREDFKTRGLTRFRDGLQDAAFGWSCNFTNVSLTAPGNMESKGKAARFDGITIKNHILWWDDWSFVETLREFALQEYPALEPIASSEFGLDYVATRLSNLRCLTPDGGKAWSWGEIALLLESLDRKQFSTFGTLWLSPDGTKAGYHTDCLVEVLENCYTTPNRPVTPAGKVEVATGKPKPNSKDGRLARVRTATDLIAKQQFNSKEALSKAIKEVHGTCSTKAGWFGVAWKRHQEIHRQRKTPKIVETNGTLEFLIADSVDDDATDNIHRSGRRIGNRRKV